MILANKGHVYRKEGIGFVNNTQQNPTIFVKGSILHVSPRDKYNFYGKYGQYDYRCSFKTCSPHKLV